MSEEVTVAGKTYISSKRAAALTHYSQDYVGYLARTGQISAQRIGGLWYVVLDSLKSYQESGKQRVEADQPIVTAPSSDPESFVGLDGKSYISASRASKSCGYNQDYVGQLARSGQIAARQVGNRWYVDEVSLRKHKDEKDALLAAVQTQSVGLPPAIGHVSAAGDTQNDSRAIMEYFADDSDLLPIPRSPEKVPAAIERLQAPAEEISGEIPDISNIQANNRISINRGSHAISGHSLVLSKPKDTRRSSYDGGSAGTLGVPYIKLASAALTIVIVVSLGFTGIRSQAVYSLLTPQSSYGAQGLAAAVTAVEPLIVALEDLLTKELRYTRND
jgi:hypothetical protein